jgi:hypothetical protein
VLDGQESGQYVGSERPPETQPPELTGETW